MTNFVKFFNAASQLDVCARFNRVNYGVSNACFESTDRLDKICKFFLSTIEGYQFFIEKTESNSAAVSLLKSATKVITGTSIFADSPYWTKEVSGKAVWRTNWEKNPCAVIGVFFFHAGHAVDFMRLSTDLGLEFFTNVGAKLGQYAVFAPIVNVGLVNAKVLNVIFGGTFACIGVLWTIHYARPEEINGKFVEKHATNFICNLSKTIVLSAVYFGSPLTPALFATGVVLGVSNAWKYVIDYDDTVASAQIKRRELAALLENQGQVIRT